MPDCSASAPAKDSRYGRGHTYFQPPPIPLLTLPPLCTRQCSGSWQTSAPATARRPRVRSDAPKARSTVPQRARRCAWSQTRSTARARVQTRQMARARSKTCCTARARYQTRYTTRHLTHRRSHRSPLPHHQLPHRRPPLFATCRPPPCLLHPSQPTCPPRSTQPLSPTSRLLPTPPLVAHALPAAAAPANPSPASVDKAWRNAKARKRQQRKKERLRESSSQGALGANAGLICRCLADVREALTTSLAREDMPHVRTGY